MPKPGKITLNEDNMSELENSVQEELQLTEPVSEHAEAASESESTQSESDNPEHVKSGFEKRVSKLNNKIRTAEQEAAFWKAEALKNSQVAQPAAAAQHVAQHVAPTLEACGGNWETYTNAVAEHKVALMLANQERQRALHEYSQRAKDFAKEHADFDEVMADVATMPVHTDIQEVIAESKVGPHLAYHLAQNPDIITQLNSMTQKQRLRELGKLEDKFESKQTVRARASAPAPVKPVSGAAPSLAKSVYDMSKEELRQHLREQNTSEIARRYKK